MIIPESRSDDVERRRTASIVTGAIVFLFTVVLVAVSVPERENNREVFRKLNPARLVELRPEIESQEDQNQSSEEESEEKDTPERAEEDATPQQAPERVDLSEVDLASSGALETDINANQQPNQNEQTDVQDAGGNTRLNVEREEIGDMGGFDTFDDPSETPIPQGTQGDGTVGEGESGIAISRGEGTSVGTEDGADFGSGGEVVGGSEGQASDAAGTSVEVALKDISDFGDDYQSIEIDKLIQWMKQNPAELPPGIARLMKYQPAFLSSKVIPLEVEGEETSYELYLMCKEDLKELYVALVDGQQAKYLVDRSFMRESRMYRVGTARRDANGVVQRVRSQQQPIGPKSEQFYQVFLSWWDNVKEEVES